MRKVSLAIFTLAALGSLLGGAWLASPAATQRGRRVGRLPSEFVYPPQRIALRMDHAHPAHRALACTRCHSEAATSTSASDRLVPTESTCLPCHEAQIDRERASDETCGLCHVGSDGREVMPSSWPSPRLHFSHAAHGEGSRADLACESCHLDVREVGLATRAQLPSMDSCWRCHGGDGIGRRVEGASHACTSCHLAAADGSLPQERAGQLFLPPRWMHGMDHDRDFMVRHRWLGADHASLCAECHTARECEDCHDGRVDPSSRQPRRHRQTVHPGDYLHAHSTEARRNEPECSACHTVQRFCTECHARLGLATVSAPSAAVSTRFHPAGFDGAAHAREARRSMSACASCHVERDCVRCHGAAGIGAGVSPHPPSFAQSCAGALSRNPRACVLCHGEGFVCP